ncbi:MAG TPA: hypothetical protein VH062_09740 [Polyangiaceae bacterium]|jgi:hypothetical protein|nr:hypothetical protein [Polyangiaceae bacterium]
MRHHASISAATWVIVFSGAAALVGACSSDARSPAAEGPDTVSVSATGGASASGPGVANAGAGGAVAGASGAPPIYFSPTWTWLPSASCVEVKSTKAVAGFKGVIAQSNSMALDDRHLYLSVNDLGQRYAASSILSIELPGANLYWTDAGSVFVNVQRSDGAILAPPTSAVGSAALVSNEGAPNDLSIANDVMYWLSGTTGDGWSNSVRSVAVTGGNARTVVAPPNLQGSLPAVQRPALTGLVASAQNLYFEQWSDPLTADGNRILDPTIELPFDQPMYIYATSIP